MWGRIPGLGGQSRCPHGICSSLAAGNRHYTNNFCNEDMTISMIRERQAKYKIQGKCFSESGDMKL